MKKDVDDFGKVNSRQFRNKKIF